MYLVWRKCRKGNTVEREISVFGMVKMEISIFRLVWYYEMNKFV